MVQNVDQVLIIDYWDTGQEKKTERFEVDLEIYWTDNSSGQHNRTKKARWPDDLDAIPATEFQRLVEATLLWIARVEFGIEEWG